MFSVQSATASNCLSLGQTLPLVSVVVPVYNHAAFVVECLDSIVETGYPNIEMVIINDCSRDNSHDIVQHWVRDNQQYNVIYVNHEQNKGLTKTLNEAISIVSGEYFCLIAADDVMLQNGIIDRVRYLMERPNKLAVFADCHVIDESGKIIFDSAIEDFYHSGLRKVELNIDSLIPYCLIFHWGIPGPVFLCRVELFIQLGGYDEELKIEDFDMYLRIASTGCLGFVDVFVSKYRVQSKSMVSSQLSMVQREAVKVIKKQSDSFKGIARMRLLAMYAGETYKEQGNLILKVYCFVKNKVLLFLSYRIYLLRKYFIVRKLI